MLTALTAGLLDLSVHPPRFTTDLSRCPIVTPLARHQAGKALQVTNTRHEIVNLDALAQQVIQRLDGCNDRDAIVDWVVEAMSAGVLNLQHGPEKKAVDPTTVPKLVDDLLEGLCKSALLVD